MQKNRSALLTFFDFRAEHCKHLRTTNAIETSFATVRLRTHVLEGTGSRHNALIVASNFSTWRKADSGSSMVIKNSSSCAEASRLSMMLNPEEIRTMTRRRPPDHEPLPIHNF
ncbi:MAG: hypothetical protein HKN10_00475 [Myxococcales bacterium]|nr:hypothetical protein [Myxococcales bacterium]